ncbi:MULTISPECIES: hypothetical protein [Paenibacillus]|uniref:Acetyl-CoA acetyltransferase n=1 Tax=Paenibacillus radicis (ex Xue et al. 2023) TaxID=2972489 RepID=A0ABT1YPK0_9BACL|nr:hypothetical protein [Paenibacillus radicis (ex Xue et al. 2023)]MCR8634655.1 hypothetical protein [Paenibacillus radicis (ex Xue et al. 2023)]
MYNQPTAVQNQPLYQMDPTVWESMNKLKDHVHGLCAKHMNHPVQVQTVQGQVYHGYIIHFDDSHLYLRPLEGHVRAFANPYAYNNVILPLVLYNLLAITLLL